jgi:hypothetical protein
MHVVSSTSSLADSAKVRQSDDNPRSSQETKSKVLLYFTTQKRSSGMPIGIYDATVETAQDLNMNQFRSHFSFSGC